MFFEVPGLDLGEPKTESQLTMKSPKQVAPKDRNSSLGSINNITPAPTTDHMSVRKAQKSGPKKSSIENSASSFKKIEHTPGKSKLQQKMEGKLRGARFRFLNQKLYQSHSREALDYFKEHPEDFQNVTHLFFNTQPYNILSIMMDSVLKFSTGP